jgi:prophage regulatory protein
MSASLVRLADVVHTVGLRKSQIYKLIRAGGFPLPVKIGRASRWSAAEIAEWVQLRLAERHTPSGVSNAR